MADSRLAPGDTAPPFTLPDSEGREVSLSDYAGRRVVVYFYPAASTPGCTKEACDFRDNLAELDGEGIDVVGIVNFETFLEQTKGYRRKLREAEYGALDDRAFLRSISPIHRVDEIAVPMMIAHGLNDPRVPVGEAMQLATALQRRGFDPELLISPDDVAAGLGDGWTVLTHEQRDRHVTRGAGAGHTADVVVRAIRS